MMEADMPCPSCGFARSYGQYGLYSFPSLQDVKDVLESHDSGFVSASMEWAKTRSQIPGFWYACIDNCGAVGQFVLATAPIEFWIDDDAVLSPTVRPGLP